jgi:hypothetical protein
VEENIKQYKKKKEKTDFVVLDKDERIKILRNKEEANLRGDTNESSDEEDEDERMVEEFLKTTQNQFGFESIEAKIQSYGFTMNRNITDD